MLELKVYTSKEICNITGYEYKKFIRNPKTLLNKLSSVYTIEKVGKGKYEVKEIKGVLDFNINNRIVNKDYVSMNDLFKPFIMRKILSSHNYSFTGTFDAWLIYTGLVYDEFVKKNKLYLKDKLNNYIDIDFFQKEGSSQYNNIIQC